MQTNNIITCGQRDFNNCCCPGRCKPPCDTGFFIPFSVSQIGSQLSTYENGDPRLVSFANSNAGSSYPVELAPNAWSLGVISIINDGTFNGMFSIPENFTLRKISVSFATKLSNTFGDQVIVYPFACLAVSNNKALTFNILQDTIAYTAPLLGGVEYPKHTLRSASISNLNIPLCADTLGIIMVGIKAENTTDEQYASFTVGGALYLE